MVKGNLLLGGVIAVVFWCSMSSNTYAVEDLDLSVTIEQASLQLTVPAAANLVLTPTSAAADFKSTNLTVKVGTNNQTGYTLTMSVPSTDISRIGAASGDPVIGTLGDQSGGYSENDFTVNKWGYKITGNNYFPITTTLAPSQWITNGPANNVDNTITLASKVSTAIPAGTYKTTLTFQAVANQVPLVSLEMAYRAYGKQKVTVGNEQYYKMQDMTANICNLVTEIPSQLEVVDVRDDTIYHIAKLADERCWMQDNLALDPVDSDVKAILSPTNTNATQAAIDNYITSSGTAPRTGWSAEAVAYETSTSVYSQPRINIASKDLTRSDLTNPEDPLTEANSWKFGVYYNYCAASMGTYCYAGGEGRNTDPDSAVDVKNDICPTGWRMPTGGAISSTGTTAGGGEYQALYDAYPSSSGGDDRYTRFRITFRLPLSGGFRDGSARDRGGYGSFWTSTYSQLSKMYRLGVSTSTAASSVDPQSDRTRNGGQAVRCIAK